MSKTNLGVAEGECQDYQSSMSDEWEQASYDGWDCACDYCELVEICAGGDESGLYFREGEG